MNPESMEAFKDEKALRALADALSTLIHDEIDVRNDLITRIRALKEELAEPKTPKGRKAQIKLQLKTLLKKYEAL